MKNKTLVIFAVVLIIGFFGVAQNADVIFAQTQDAKEQKTVLAAQSPNQDLLAIIEQLKNQIKELQDQLAKLMSEVAIVKEEIKITKELYKGVSGNEVKEVQKFLKQFSEIYPEGLVTGYYGPLTEKAVRKFQEKAGLPATGKIDEITRNKINEYLTGDKERKITICHYPPENPSNKHSLEISESAMETHLTHGDALGACEAQPTAVSPAPESAPTKPTSVPVPSPTAYDEIKELRQLISGLQQKEQTPERIAEISILQKKLAAVESQKKVVSSVSGIVQVTGAKVMGVGQKGTLCALTKDGLVFCHNDFMNKIANKSFRPTFDPLSFTGGFVVVPGLNNVASIASADDSRVCVVKTDNSALCWGDNSYGQLGDGTLVGKTEPTQVFGLGSGTTASISMGRKHTCALKTDGSVVCWGSNDTGSGSGGQIGHGDKTKTIELLPTQVSGLGPKSTVALSSDYNGTCAIKTDNSVVCWGDIHPIGYSGTYAPVKISQKLGAIKSIVTSFKNTFALKADGSVVGWGQNYCGQLGNGRQETGGLTQVTGLGPGSTAAIASGSGSYHSCALKTDGSVVCWGCGGKVGDGTVLNRYTPVQPVGLGAGTTAAISDTASCAVKIDGSVVCWGIGDVPTSVPGLK